MNHRTAHVPATHRDQPVGLEDVDGLAKRGRADTELGEQDVLRREYVTFSDAPGQDVIAQPGRNDLGDPWLADPLHAGHQPVARR